MSPATFQSSVTFEGGFTTSNSNPEILFVTLSGSDTSGDGSYFSPYRTIHKALQSVVALGGGSTVRPYLIQLGAGTFFENTVPLSIPPGVGIRGQGHTMTRVTTAATSSTLFEMGFQSFLYDMVVNGSQSYTNNGVLIDISSSSSVAIAASFLVPRITNVIFSNFEKAVTITGISGGVILRENFFNDCHKAVNVISQSIFTDIENCLFNYSLTTGSCFVLSDGTGNPTFGDEPPIFVRGCMFRNSDNIVYTENTDQSKGLHLAIGNCVSISSSIYINLNDSSLVTVRGSRNYNTVNYELYQGYSGGKCAFIANAGDPTKIYVQPTGTSNVKGITFSIFDSDSIWAVGEHPETIYRLNSIPQAHGAVWRTRLESPGIFVIDVATDTSGSFATYHRPFYLNESGSLRLTSYHDNITLISSGNFKMVNSSSILFLLSGDDTANYVGFSAPTTVSSSLIYKWPAAVPVTQSYLETDALGNLSWTTGIGGETNTISNLGTGFGIYAQKVGSDLQLKSLIAGTGVSFTSSSQAITMSISTAGEANTASNLGTDYGLFAQKSGVDLQFKSLVAGSGIQFFSSSTGITIATTGSGGDITSGSNLGSGTGLFASKVLGTLEFKSLTFPSSSLGADLQVSASATEVALSRRSLSSTISLQEDWLTSTYQGNLYWTQTNSGAGSGATIISTDVNSANKAIGEVQLSTGTTTAGRAALSLGLISWRLDNLQNSVMEWRIMVPALSTAAQEYGVAIGWLSTNTATAQTNGLYFYYNRLTTGDVWYTVSANGGVRTETSSGVAVSAGSFVKLRIETNPSNTQVLFYIDNVLVKTETTNLPTGTGKLVGPGLIIAKTAGTLARTFNADYMDVIANISGR